MHNTIYKASIDAQDCLTNRSSKIIHKCVNTKVTQHFFVISNSSSMEAVRRSKSPRDLVIVAFQGVKTNTNAL